MCFDFEEKREIKNSKKVNFHRCKMLKQLDASFS